MILEKNEWLSTAWGTTLKINPSDPVYSQQNDDLWSLLSIRPPSEIEQLHSLLRKAPQNNTTNRSDFGGFNAFEYAHVISGILSKKEIEDIRNELAAQVEKDSNKTSPLVFLREINFARGRGGTFRFSTDRWTRIAGSVFSSIPRASSTLDEAQKQTVRSLVTAAQAETNFDSKQDLNWLAEAVIESDKPQVFESLLSVSAESIGKSIPSLVRFAWKHDGHATGLPEALIQSGVHDGVIGKSEAKALATEWLEKDRALNPAGTGPLWALVRNDKDLVEKAFKMLEKNKNGSALNAVNFLTIAGADDMNVRKRLKSSQDTTGDKDLKSAIDTSLKMLSDLSYRPGIRFVSLPDSLKKNIK
jgi:hypothetical protein